MRQIWHTASNDIDITSDAMANEGKGLYSRYYSLKQPNKQIELLTNDNKITTIIKFSNQ
jgi:hypothetical protein